MSDREAIRGLWRLVTTRRDRRPFHTEITHISVTDTEWRRIDPNRVGPGSLIVTVRLDEETEPRRIEWTEDLRFPPVNRRDRYPLVRRGLYRLDGDRLTYCVAEGEAFPTELSDDHGELFTAERDFGPVPERPLPPGPPPLIDDLLGRLEWSVELPWYVGVLTFEGLPLDLQIEPFREGGIEAALARCRAVVRESKRYLELAIRFAADALTETKNDSWLSDDEAPLTKEQFADRLYLESITLQDSGTVQFAFDDDDIFCGHLILVRIDANDMCVGVDLCG